MKPALPRWVLVLVLLPVFGHAKGVVYRCPGPPMLYTDAISAKEATAQGCTAIEGSPISVIPAPKRAGPAPNTSATAPPAGSAPRERVEPGVQKSRDSDRRLVLETELRTAEARLAEIRKEYADGNPERQGGERNYAKYQERVAELKAALARQEADVQAIRRELAKVQ
jgi:hypothetical protein